MSLRPITPSAFQGDDGSASPGVEEALTQFATAPGVQTHAVALGALSTARLLVPVVAILGEVEYDEHGRASDKGSEMATVLLTGDDGRVAQLAFTSAEALVMWQADARPVPVRASDAAKAALADHADALLVDLAGPVPFVIEGDDLRSLAKGMRLVQVGSRTAWIS